MRGKQLSYQGYTGREEDHPRGCGENTGLQARRRQLPGSPPRMRGKHSTVFLLSAPDGITPADAGKTALTSSLPVSDDGITPADAGKTKTRLTASLSARDHPRGCGENQQVGERALKLLGSPPRMRGKQHSVKVLVAVLGITPADAGKTL